MTGNLIITSGQLPVNPETGTMPETIEEQAEQSCINVGNVLEAVRSEEAHV